MQHTFWSCLIRCANMKWIWLVLWKIQSGHSFVPKTDGRTDGQTDGQTTWNQYTPLSTSFMGGGGGGGVYNYLFMLGFKLNHVSERGPRDLSTACVNPKWRMEKDYLSRPQGNARNMLEYISYSNIVIMIKYSSLAVMDVKMTNSEATTD